MINSLYKQSQSWFMQLTLLYMVFRNFFDRFIFQTFQLKFLYVLNCLKIRLGNIGNWCFHDYTICDSVFNIFCYPFFFP
jgi:hypothetical protein